MVKILRNILLYNNINFQHPKGKWNNIEIRVHKTPHGPRFIELWQTLCLDNDLGHFFDNKNCFIGHAVYV